MPNPLLTAASAGPFADAWRAAREGLHNALYRLDVLAAVSPQGDAQYRAWMAQRAEQLGSYNQLAPVVGPALLGTVLLVLLRFVWVKLAAPRLLGRSAAAREAAAARGARQQQAGAAAGPAGAKGGAGGDAGSSSGGSSSAAAADGVIRWAEAWWTMAGSGALLAWGWHCILTRNGGCPGLRSQSAPAAAPAGTVAAPLWGVRPDRWVGLDTDPCMDGWPMLPLDPAVLRYYGAELAWYLHLLAKHPLGLGLSDSPLLLLHHLTSLFLLGASYCLSLHRAGVLMLALLNCSTPLLHASKLAHHTGQKLLALAAFGCFALVFLVSRVVLFPPLFITIGLIQPLRAIPRVLDHYPGILAAINVCLGLFIVMQFVWYAAVVRVLLAAASGDPNKLGKSAVVLERKGAAAGAAEDSGAAAAAPAAGARKGARASLGSAPPATVLSVLPGGQQGAAAGTPGVRLIELVSDTAGHRAPATAQPPRAWEQPLWSGEAAGTAEPCGREEGQRGLRVQVPGAEKWAGLTHGSPLPNADSDCDPSDAGMSHQTSADLSVLDSARPGSSRRTSGSGSGSARESCSGAAARGNCGGGGGGDSSALLPVGGLGRSDDLGGGQVGGAEPGSGGLRTRAAWDARCAGAEAAAPAPAVPAALKAAPAVGVAGGAAGAEGGLSRAKAD